MQDGPTYFPSGMPYTLVIEHMAFIFTLTEDMTRGLGISQHEF